MIKMTNFKLKTVKEGDVTSPQGFQAVGIHCGIKKKKKDLGLILSEGPAVSAAVYTTNAFQAAPLKVTQQSLAKGSTLRALVVNSGNANAFTGEQGMVDALMMRNAVADSFQLSPWEVAVTSTGVIGERLPIEKILAGIEQLPHLLGEDGASFSEAILTTDTFAKSLAVEIEIEGKTVTIGGTAKGSGMIHPNMATMLAFVTTDAKIHPDVLQRLLHHVTDQTFNMITVDGDTSTNDMVLVMANGFAGHTELTEAHPDWPVFVHGFHYVSEQLAKMIAQDGEGATKLIEVVVQGAATEEMAKVIAKKIVGSNLVKTAVFGADGNWGRVVMAIGNSGFYVDEKQLDITIGHTLVVQKGIVMNYEEEAVTQSFKENKVKILVDLNQGEQSATAWGCDLTYDYVKINASYRT
ncbi:bifunctional ornithine acetyltransferase/N-acetylglutamate synthase [Tepidibacillus infernus]|uniref:bifunctional ornithine acetyltransferase/N-acetylglutamate synthase n=1 Tax=Tepidibacillus infernus TaxID=1806172 RepID=UPI003B68E440